jgi:type II secretory pathway pseudopilin PulG
MAFCAWCGNHVPAVSYASCARCGNPTNGAQRVAGGASGGQGAGLVIGLLIGGLALVAVLGILAAIAIPNLLTAMQRSKQKRTTADMRMIASALEAYGTDHNQYPPGNTAADLTSALTPRYIKTLPELDGWGNPIWYGCWPAGECRSYAIGSAGGDKVFEHDSLQEYTAGTKTTNFDNDLVFSDGDFVQYPEGVQTGGR